MFETFKNLFTSSTSEYEKKSPKPLKNLPHLFCKDLIKKNIEDIIQNGNYQGNSLIHPSQFGVKKNGLSDRQNNISREDILEYTQHTKEGFTKEIQPRIEEIFNITTSKTNIVLHEKKPWFSPCEIIGTQSNFYCTKNSKVYLSLSYIKDLINTFGYSAYGYLIKHELAHHIQKDFSFNLKSFTKGLSKIDNFDYDPRIINKYLDIYSKITSKEECLEYSIANEQWADMISGTSARILQETGYKDLDDDINKTLIYLHQIGDDSFKKETQDTFAWQHGSGIKRVEEYTKGINSGCFANSTMSYFLQNKHHISAN